MPPGQLRDTTMDPKKRTLLKVVLPNGGADAEALDAKETAELVEQLMGRKPELRFAFIQENAEIREGGERLARACRTAAARLHADFS